MTHVTKGKLFHAGCVAFVVFTVSGVLAAAAMCIVLTMWQQQQPATLGKWLHTCQYPLTTCICHFPVNVTYHLNLSRPYQCY